MSYEVGKQALDFLIENSGNRVNLEVDFFGGEPLMNFDVVKRLVEYGRSREKEANKNFRFTLTTNGVLLNDEIIDFCNKEISNVVLSLDGRKEIHDLMRLCHILIGGITIGTGVAQQVAVLVQQTVVHTPGVDTHAVQIAYIQTFERQQTLFHLIEEIRQIPVEHAVHLDVVVLKTMQLLHDDLIPIKGTQNGTAIAGAQIKCK
jgi:hypothetical protein